VTNGFIEFVGPATTNTAFTNTAIPTTARPNGAVYAFWDDLFVDASASVRTELKGALTSDSSSSTGTFTSSVTDAPDRRLDRAARERRDPDAVQNIANDARERGSSATYGIENQAGNVALQFGFNAVSLQPDGSTNSIRYVPPTP
jgi:hypothetical protein